MDKITCEELPGLFEGPARLFAEKKEELCKMDAIMGDGDLGLTMSRGFGALPDLIQENMKPGNMEETLIKAGMKMLSIVPSTMGTLMSSGIIEGAKALKGKTSMGPTELADFLSGFAAGIQKRGKCQRGDRTLLDAISPAAQKAAEAAEAGGNLCEVIHAAATGAGLGVEATKNMVPKFGKAAIFAEKALGSPDQGAVAGQYMIEGMRNVICQG